MDFVRPVTPHCFAWVTIWLTSTVGLSLTQKLVLYMVSLPANVGAYKRRASEFLQHQCHKRLFFFNQHNIFQKDQLSNMKSVFIFVLIALSAAIFSYANAVPVPQDDDGDEGYKAQSLIVSELTKELRRLMDTSSDKDAETETLQDSLIQALFEGMEESAAEEQQDGDDDGMSEAHAQLVGGLIKLITGVLGTFMG